jgi:hypothetical protein
MGKNARHTRDVEEKISFCTSFFFFFSQAAMADNARHTRDVEERHTRDVEKCFF